MDVPKAPGLGLLLERLHYESYDKRFSKSHTSLENLGEEVENSILKIRDELIVSEILSTECQSQSLVFEIKYFSKFGFRMMMWLSGLPMHNFATNSEDDPEQSVSALSVLNSNQRSTKDATIEECDTAEVAEIEGVPVKDEIEEKIEAGETPIIEEEPVKSEAKA